MKPKNRKIFLKIYNFSILVDESTDIGNTKFVCILVQFWSQTEKIVKIQLLELPSLDATNCSAS